MGSWAGALGQPQFMPTTYLAYAEDFDGDGPRDIWSSLANVFASIARYLRDHGWVKGQRWGREVRLPRAAARLVEEAPLRTAGCSALRETLRTAAARALGRARGQNGRLAGTPLSEGVSPVQGHDLQGPTAAANSVAKLDHARTNGTLLNMKIDPAALRTPDDLRKLAALIRAYFDQGGHHVQFNIVDRAVLEDAMVHPERHRDLIIRVAGYSDYFVLLSPDIQREILSRTEHAL